MSNASPAALQVAKDYGFGPDACEFAFRRLGSSDALIAAAAWCKSRSVPIDSFALMFETIAAIREAQK